jgi:isopentenyldiphosphate isomerase
MTKDTFPGAWDSSASGHLDTGEDYDACAVREVREELGIVMERPPERLFKIVACPETGQEHVWVYRYDCEAPFCLHPEEIERGEWFTTAQIDEALRTQDDEAFRTQEFASAFVRIWDLVGRNL